MKTKISRPMVIKIIIATLLSVVASLYFDLAVTAIAGTLTYLTWIKFGILALTSIAFFIFEKSPRTIAKYAALLAGISAATLLNEYLQTFAFVNHFSQSSTFAENVGANVVLKLLSAALIIGLMFALFHKADAIYIKPGDLRVKAEPIPWLGISKNWVSWGRLAPISGALIAVVTIGLTMITVTGAGMSVNFSLFFRMLPFILVYALINSFSEGILFRNGILASLTTAFPKFVVLILSALIFGSFHYYGAPGGILGIIMSSVLGWFMARSLYETKGFVAPWIIHFMQDFVIFSTMVLLGTFLG